MADMRIFAERLKEARKRKDLTQRQLADKIQTTTATISAYESTNRQKGKNPSLENAQNLAKELNVSLDWLCGIERIDTVSGNNMTGKQLLYSLIALDKYFSRFMEEKVNIWTESIIDGASGKSDEEVTKLLAIGALDVYEWTNIRIDSNSLLRFVDSYLNLKDLKKQGVMNDELFDICMDGLLNKSGKALNLELGLEYVNNDYSEVSDLPY